MVRSVTATEANRSFSKLLRAAERGESIEITSHGRKVATLMPALPEAADREARHAALAALKKRWATQKRITVGGWSREELYQPD